MLRNLLMIALCSAGLSLAVGCGDDDEQPMDQDASHREDASHEEDASNQTDSSTDTDGSTTDGNVDTDADLVDGGPRWWNDPEGTPVDAQDFCEGYDLVCEFDDVESRWHDRKACEAGYDANGKQQGCYATHLKYAADPEMSELHDLHCGHAAGYGDCNDN